MVVLVCPKCNWTWPSKEGTRTTTAIGSDAVGEGGVTCSRCGYSGRCDTIGRTEKALTRYYERREAATQGKYRGVDETVMRMDIKRINPTPDTIDAIVCAIDRGSVIRVDAYEYRLLPAGVSFDPKSMKAGKEAKDAVLDTSSLDKHE